MTRYFKEPKNKYHPKLGNYFYKIEDNLCYLYSSTSNHWMWLKFIESYERRIISSKEEITEDELIVSLTMHELIT